jgi:hypothetical protein
MSRLARAIILCAFLLVTVGAAPAEPAPHTASERLQRAEVCMAALDFDCARRELEAAAPGIDTLSKSRHHLRLVAEVALAQERPKDADSALDALLELAPDFAPQTGTWPDAWLAALDRAHKRAPDRSPPTLVVQAPTAAMDGQVIEISAETEDRSGVGRVMLYVARTHGDALSFALGTTDGRHWRVKLDASLVRAPAVEFWVEAFDQHGNGPTRWGAPETPKSIVISLPEIAEEAAFYETWWFWTAVGVGVVAGGVGLALALREDSPGGEPGARFGNANLVLDYSP